MSKPSFFDFLSPYDGPVVPGLEQYEKVYAKDQPEYIPLRTLPGQQGISAIARMALTPKQRQAIAYGADIYIELLHFGGPLAPSRVMVAGPMPDSDAWRSWWRAATGGTYPV